MTKLEIFKNQLEEIESHVIWQEKQLEFYKNQRDAYLLLIKAEEAKGEA